MKFVQVIPIPVTYSRNLESFFVERSRIVDLLLFSLSLLEEVSNNWNEEARCTPRRDISANLFSLRYFHGSMTTTPLISTPEENRQSRGKCRPHENIGPPRLPFSCQRRWGIRRHFCRRGGGGAIVEKSWKNSFWNERIFGGEVFQASRATLTTRCCNVMI